MDERINIYRDLIYKEDWEGILTQRAQDLSSDEVFVFDFLDSYLKPTLAKYLPYHLWCDARSDYFVEERRRPYIAKFHEILKPERLRRLIKVWDRFELPWPYMSCGINGDGDREYSYKMMPTGNLNLINPLMHHVCVRVVGKEATVECFFQKKFEDGQYGTSFFEIMEDFSYYEMANLSDIG